MGRQSEGSIHKLVETLGGVHTKKSTALNMLFLAFCGNIILFVSLLIHRIYRSVVQYNIISVAATVKLGKSNGLTNKML